MSFNLATIGEIDSMERNPVEADSCVASQIPSFVNPHCLNTVRKGLYHKCSPVALHQMTN